MLLFPEAKLLLYGEEHTANIAQVLWDRSSLRKPSIRSAPAVRDHITELIITDKSWL